jgi:hypothetical protein
MNTKKIVITLFGFIMLSGVLATTTNAATWNPNLPTTVVQLTAMDGELSYFAITLSGVPPGFDVQNGLYNGWCVNGAITMLRDTPHDVVLYSSLTPPSGVENINWVAINYILNHRKGAMMDVQDAIWCIIGDKDISSISSIAQDMVNEAPLNTDYNPAEGAILAVICLPQEDEHAQPTIIELRRCGLSPGYWKHNVKVYNGGPGHYSGTPTHESDDTMEGYAATILAAGYPSIPSDVDTPQEFLGWANTRFQDNAYKKADPSWLELANWFNTAAGLTPYSD